MKCCHGPPCDGALRPLACFGPSSTANFNSLVNVLLPLERFPGESLLLIRNFSGYAPAFRKAAELVLKAAAEKDVKSYSQHDIEFHRVIMEGSQNSLLLSIWESVVLESRFRLTLKSIGEDQLSEFGTAHLPVIDALRKGDGKAAGKLLKNLICKFHFLKND